MPNVCLTIAYDGTRYAGWQTQKNAKTVQETIEKALKKILNEKVNLIASGRTDSGVHAKAQIANFKTKHPSPTAKLKLALNPNLPNDISVTAIREAPTKFHSRYDAKSKLYRYTILNSTTDDPFLWPYYCRVTHKLNVSLMKKEAKALLGRHDFKAFQAKSDRSSVKNTVRTVKKVSVKKKNTLIHIDIEANGFLYNMVRNIVGSLLEIGRGYFPEGSMKKILSSKNRRIAGPTAHPKGLTLIKVKYR